MTTGRINQIAFVEKGTETRQTDATPKRGASRGFRMLSDKVFSNFLSPRGYREVSVVADRARLPSPVLPGSEV